jgi:hypothetical protein
MISRRAKNPPKVDQLLPVELEHHDRGPTGCGEALHPEEIVAPPKVVSPSLKSWIEQSYDFSRERVLAGDLVVLLVVAALAADAKLLRPLPPPLDTGTT